VLRLRGGEVRIERDGLLERRLDRAEGLLGAEGHRRAGACVETLKIEVERLGVGGERLRRPAAGG
jgi:hypothetical protein